MMKKTFIPNKQIILELESARVQDMLIRGREHSVYDKDGKVVMLQHASVWYDDKGHYVKPRSTQELTCVIS